MPVTIQIMTSKREHLLDLATKMARAIEDEFLADPQKPVTVSMRGSFSCGKKIFPDMFREVLGATEKSNAFYSDQLYKLDEYGRTIWPKDIHKKGFFTTKESEFWTGPPGGKPVEVHLLDAGYVLEGYPPMASSVRQWNKMKENFLTKRSQGGATFISNDEQGASSGIDIWIQNKRSHVKIGAEKDRAKISSLSKEFNSSSDPWSRYVEITVNDERLLASPRFKAFVADMQNPDNGYRQQGHETIAQKLLSKVFKKPLVSVSES